MNHLTCVRKGRNKYGKGAGRKSDRWKKVCLRQTVFDTTVQLPSNWSGFVTQLYRTTGIERCPAVQGSGFKGYSNTLMPENIATFFARISKTWRGRLRFSFSIVAKEDKIDPNHEAGLLVFLC